MENNHSSIIKPNSKDQETQTGLCINLEAWDGEGDGREFQKGREYVYLWLINVEAWQKTAKFCKAIILQ